MVSCHYLLDTDICIYAVARRAPSVLARFDALKPGEAALSVIAFGELCTGAAKSSHPQVVWRNLAALISIAGVKPLPVEAARRYGELRAALERKGTPVGANDLWIAAHALAEGLTLVTNNEREFRRVPKLKIENWAA